jgi:16S rRNA G966 N2-methylase RsmD
MNQQNLTNLPNAGRLYQPFLNSTTENLKQFLLRRNNQLIDMFSETGRKVTLAGNAEKPIIIVDDKIELSAYAHNFDLIFKDAPYNGTIILRMKINNRNKVLKDFLDLFLESYEQQRAKKKRRRTFKQVFAKIKRNENRKPSTEFNGTVQ